MKNKYKRDYLVGCLLYKENIKQTSSQETKLIVKANFLKKLYSLKNKSFPKNLNFSSSVSKSNQSKRYNKQLNASSLFCSNQHNISTLHCSVNYSEINLNRQLINYQNIIKPKRGIIMKILSLL
jgi:hypothetical protein